MKKINQEYKAAWEIEFAKLSPDKQALISESPDGMESVKLASRTVEAMKKTGSPI